MKGYKGSEWVKVAAFPYSLCPIILRPVIRDAGPDNLV